MSLIFVVLSIIAAIVGLLTLSSATAGVGLIGIGGIFAIYARLAQAEVHQRALRQLMEESLPKQNTATGPSAAPKPPWLKD